VAGKKLKITRIQPRACMSPGQVLVSGRDAWSVLPFNLQLVITSPMLPHASPGWRRSTAQAAGRFLACRHARPPGSRLSRPAVGAPPPTRRSSAAAGAVAMAMKLSDATTKKSSPDLACTSAQVSPRRKKRVPQQAHWSRKVASLACRCAAGAASAQGREGQEG
jgi:hypothetical protein